MLPFSDQHKKIILCSALIFLLLYLWLPFSTPLKFNSPDETANYFWAKHFATTGSLYFFEPLNLEVDGLIHPRSMVSMNGFTLPGSFLGLPVLYGLLGKIFSINILPFLTAILAVLAAFALYGVMSRIHGKHIALLSFFLFLIHPAVFYYTSRQFFHNIPFVAFLIFAAYFYISRPFLKLHEHHVNEPNRLSHSLDYLLGAVMLALALFIRTSEAPWVLAATAILFLIKRPGRLAHAFHITLGVLVILALVIAVMNQSLYGNFLQFGYTVKEQTQIQALEAADEEVVGVSLPNLLALSKSTLQSAANMLFPFGIRVGTITDSVWQYFIKMLWWFTVPVVIGLVWTLWQWSNHLLKKKQVVYFLLSIIICGYLFIYYGSFVLQDNPTIGRITITSSYLRYWLPVFVLLLPYAARALYLVASIFKRYNPKITVLVAEVGFMAVLSFNLSIYGLDDGLISIRRNSKAFAQVSDRVMQLTSSDAVIIVDRGDKIFFPERRVVYPLRDNATFAALPKLVARAPVYYYGIGVSVSETNSLRRRFKAIGLTMERVEIFGKEVLYKISNF